MIIRNHDTSPACTSVFFAIIFSSFISESYPFLSLSHFYPLLSPSVYFSVSLFSPLFSSVSKFIIHLDLLSCAHVILSPYAGPKPCVAIFHYSLLTLDWPGLSLVTSGKLLSGVVHLVRHWQRTIETCILGQMPDVSCATLLNIGNVIFINTAISFSFNMNIRIYFSISKSCPVVVFNAMCK